MPQDSIRTIYGPNKYAAFHLMLARWLRHYAANHEYCYVTLGGTELRDLQHLHFIDSKLIVGATSFEQRHERYLIASKTAEKLTTANLPILTKEGDIFNFERTNERPHLFFIDLEGTCILADYHIRFAYMILNEVLKEGDTLFITSYLGRNIGWTRLFTEFDGEFRVLGLGDRESKKRLFRKVHPSFTLFRALTFADLQQEVGLKCIGSVEYRDSSTMALYGYTVSEGKTEFDHFIRETPYFNLKRAYL